MWYKCMWLELQKKSGKVQKNYEIGYFFLLIMEIQPKQSVNIQKDDILLWEYNQNSE